MKHNKDCVLGDNYKQCPACMANSSEDRHEPKKKKLRPSKKIIQSLISLRNELYLDGSDTPQERIVLWKINSCLYGDYPTKA